jgi:excinuclease ABC subunit C
MDEASEGMEYERAATLRDKIRAVERTMESQKMAAFSRDAFDLAGLARSGAQAAIQLFAIRDGKAVGRDVFLLEAPPDVADSEVVGGFLGQYYARTSSIPPRVLVPLAVPDAPELEAWLASRRGGSVRIAVPQRGSKRELLSLAARNAGETLAREQARWMADEGRTGAALAELASALGLAAPPGRIECYDISTFQGSETVGSMVVFEDGRPRTGEYRRFRVRTVEGRPDDVASHREVLGRRFRGAKPGDEGSAEELRWRLPDLVLIDGGKPQVAAAVAAMAAAGVGDIPLAGIAKEREELFLPGVAEPVVLPATSPALYLVQRIRDEAHRSAIGYHRRLRAKASVRSVFDDMPGIGPRRRAALLRVFGSVKRIREAPVEQIAAVPGIGPRTAASIKEALADG